MDDKTMAQNHSKYLSFPNWDDLQHYKDRSPPWIKLHNSLLESYEFECLPDASKGHLLCIMLLASRTNNNINPDPKWIARKIGASSRVDIKLLVSAGFLQLNQPLPNEEQSASTTLAECLPRGEERRERGEEEESKKWLPPEGLNLISWEEFEQHRKLIKKPLSDLARTKAANLIKHLDHANQQATIDKSIQSRWPGLFPEKINDAYKSTNQTHAQRTHEQARNLIESMDARDTKTDGGAIYEII